MKVKVKHRWRLSCKEAVNLQRSLRKKLILKDCLPKKIKYLAGVDVSYDKRTDKLYACVVVIDFKDLRVVDSSSWSGRSTFPYIPGLLSFRESPAIIKTLTKLRTRPDILVFDGHGIAHPRGFGIASHVGVLFDVPTIGCAKTRLFGTHKEPKDKKGSFSPLLWKMGEEIGSVLRTRDNVKPVFVSPGHRISNGSARKIILKCTAGYRIPVPTREAHILSNKLRVLNK